jgi:hypothetical protein
MTDYMEQKLNIVLDLDNTLLCAVDFREIMDSNFDPIFSEKLKYIDFIFDNKPLYRIFLRPNLEDFLDYLFDEFNVSVFTNADKDYADFVATNIILKSTKPRKLDFVFYRYHSNIVLQNYGKMKDLRFIWEMAHIYYFFPSNTIIIDDLYLVKQSNYYNCLAIKPFEISLRQLMISRAGDKVNNLSNETYQKYLNSIFQDNSLINVSRKLFLLNKRYSSSIQTPDLVNEDSKNNNLNFPTISSFDTSKINIPILIDDKEIDKIY